MSVEFSKAKLPRIGELEGLRALMAWMVVLNHSIDLFASQHRGFGRWLIGGGQAVQVFVILSGFVIAYLLNRKSPSLVRFWIERFFRLWPLLMVCLIASILAEPIYRHNLNAMQDVMPAAEWRLSRLDVWDQNDHIYFTLSATMLHTVVPEFVFTYCDTYRLPPTWSIGLEWSFYLIAPFVISAISKKRAGLFLWCCILVACVSFKWQFARWNPHGLPLYAPLFGFGIASYYLISHARTILSRISPAPFAAGVVALGALGGEPALIWCVVLLALIPDVCEVIPLFKIVKKILNHRILRFLGSISYSTYLCHWMILALVQWTMLDCFQIQPGDLGESWVAYTGVIVLVGMVSVVLHYSVERPFIRIGKLFSEKVGHSRT